MGVQALSSGLPASRHSRCCSTTGSRITSPRIRSKKSPTPPASTLRFIVATLALCVALAQRHQPVGQLSSAGRPLRVLLLSIHFTIYVVTTFFIEGFSNFDVSGLGADLVKLAHITAGGFVAFVLMISLAILPLLVNCGWGGKKWNLLHKLICITALAAVFRTTSGRSAGCHAPVRRYWRGGFARLSGVAKLCQEAGI